MKKTPVNSMPDFYHCIVPSFNFNVYFDPPVGRYSVPVKNSVLTK